MLITCDGCNSKIRVPDKAAGKRVKCPKCATMIKVPALETPPDAPSADSATAGVSSTPLPPPPEAETPREQPAEETTGNEVTSTPSSKGSKPPPIKKSSGGKPAWDDNPDDDDGREKKRSKRDDDDDEDEDDDDDRKKKRRKRDDDDDLDVRKKRGRKGTPNSLALTSMIIGIVSAVFALPACWPGCCCFVPSLIAIATGTVAVITGFMGKGKPESDGMAMTGIICGFVGIGCAVAGVLLYFAFIFFRIGVVGMQNF
jgi:predicted Zn finger-like uncharacterized protein